jgi:hypothetical protein
LSHPSLTVLHHKPVFGALLAVALGVVLSACVHADAAPPTCSPTQEPVKTTLVYGDDSPYPEGATYACMASCPEGQRRVLVGQDAEPELKLFVFNGKRQREVRYECKPAPADRASAVARSPSTSPRTGVEIRSSTGNDLASAQPAPSATTTAEVTPSKAPTSVDFWAQARQEDQDSESAALDRVESDLAVVEGKTAWSDAETDRVARCAHVVGEMTKAPHGPLDARLSRVVSRLTPLVKRAIALDEAKKKTGAAQQARRDAEARRQLLPACIQCCLTAFIGATRDHCQTSCEANPNNYAGINSAEFVKQYGGSLLYCRTP